MAEGGNTAKMTDNAVQMEIPSDEEDNNLTAFLEKAKCDRMNELRQIEFGERPVSNTENKDRINQFFSKHLHAHEQKLESGKENVPMNVEDVAEVRPETVVVEIQGLVEQQRVSNILSTNFRRRLENVIRGSLTSVTRNPRPSPRTSVSRSNTPQASPFSTTVPTPSDLSRDGTPSETETQRDRPATPVNRIQREAERSRSNSVASSNRSTESQPDVAEPIPPHFETLVPHPAEIALEVIEEQQREELVQEISELVHRQIVTSTLQGNFRTTLEVSMRDRLDNSGFNGERVQQFVQSIHPSQPIIRNDFSHLGLPAQGTDNWDNISVTSVSTHAVPYTQSNLYLSREMASLKAQVEEMKNMLRVSFDLQLDIQRAIRQEVAAAMSEKSDGTHETETAKCSKPVSDSHCLICLDKFSDSVLYQCGHMCVCYGCGRHLMSRGSNCPVCRAPIKDIIRAYRCNQD